MGCLACTLAVVPQSHDGIRRGLLRAMGVALGLVTLSSAGILLSRTLEMNGGSWGALGTDLRPALVVTHFGRVWRWRIPALAVAWLAWAWTLRHPRHWWASGLTALAIVAIVMTRSETGHAADHGDFTFAVWNDWAHVLAAGAWVGSLFGMSLVVFPRLQASEHPLPASAHVFQRLSTWCGIALAVLVAAGILNALRELGGDATALVNTRYGITLDVKLAIVLAMILIGAHNRYIKLPQLLRAARGDHAPTTVRPRAGTTTGVSEAQEADIVRTCARAVLLESLLGVAVIGVTAVLIHGMPPADMRTLRAPPPRAAAATMPTRAPAEK